MPNPFEDENASYLMLINDEAQHSLWLEHIEVPDGWSVTHGPDSRQACLDYVETHWTRMRPQGLIAPPEAAADGSDSRA